jgi:hypothetical protein
MGIRIHKSLGYGVKNFVATSDWEETWERIYNLPLKDFTKWLESNLDLIGVSEQKARLDLLLFKALLREAPKRISRGARLGDSIIFDDEFGIKGVLQLVPPGYYNWRRDDDTIDYYEETPGSEPCEPRYRELSHGIYPFSEGEIPVVVKGLAHYLGIPEIIPDLKASVYVYWA